MDKVPVALIIGEQNMAERTVSIRSKDGESTLPLSDLVDYLRNL